MRSHRMKPGKGLTSHGTSNGANHLESLITKIAKSSLSHWILIKPLPLSLFLQLAVRPCLNCRPLIAGSFRWPPGQLPPSSLIGREDHVTWALIGHVTPVLASHWLDPDSKEPDWLRAADAPVGT